MKVADVGGVIRAYRKASGMSQKDLAVMVGISRATLNYLESGRDLDIGAVKLLALLELLGIPVGIPAHVDRDEDERVLQKAVKAASGGGRGKLTRKTVVEAMATGRVPDGSAPGLRALLDAADPAMALTMVRVVSAGTGQPPKSVWKHARSVAADVECTAPLWGQPADPT